MTRIRVPIALSIYIIGYRSLVSAMPIEYVLLAREVEVLSARCFVAGQPAGLVSDSTTVAETVFTTTIAFCVVHTIIHGLATTVI